MTLAQHCGSTGSDAHVRALQLAKLAVKKAPDDPRILMAAYWQHYKLGREDEADPAWFERAVTLSSESEGPVWSVDLPDLINNWIPKRRDHLREVERKWLNGEIPMSLAAGVFNVSLARIFLHIPDQNANESGWPLQSDFAYLCWYAKSDRITENMDCRARRDLDYGSFLP